MGAFARRAIEVALHDRVLAMKASSWVFFDRGLIDAAAALQRLTGEFAPQELIQANRYNSRVFLMPPWPTSIGAMTCKRPYRNTSAFSTCILLWATRSRSYRKRRSRSVRTIFSIP